MFCVHDITTSFREVAADWESFSRQFKTSIYTFRGEGSSGQKNLHSTPVEDRSGGRRPDCLTATSEVRGEAARNWSPASNLFEFEKQGTSTNLLDVEEGADLDLSLIHISEPTRPY